ncbi:unnamed protein product (macronuclear) [Paramecium tetraurelia]|uniref:SPRY domain-containing protein n=1 Tax=Paramecium tetraurelia TaxID=5888 RepID=A0EFS7_PARTE|nr:uncharacterized protein GSPATT00026491001 [Paramecium tetraurelia]CAK94168.1 unnamed protein product [Paramecium tetraurelia]|eukprot:XP_001461541.1 hypothetical protein (macronuclear) [Paramecium tetraurelia strain d4-2]
MSQYCIYEDHNEGTIIGVCTKLNCKYMGASCSTCLQSFHNKHFQEFFLDFKGLLQNWQQKIKTYCKLKSLQQQFNRLNIDLDDMIVRFNIEVQEQNFEHYTLQELKALTQKLAYLGLIEQYINPLEDLIQRMHAQIKSVKDLSLIQLRFSNELKSDNIVLNIQGSIASTSDEHLGLVLCETGVNKDSQVQEFTFKILKMDWMAIGIGHKDHIQCNKKKFDIWENSQHGCYLIDSIGKVFSPGDNNNKKNNFSLKINDIITVKVDKTNKNVLWTDQNKQQLSVKFVEQSQIMEFDVSQCICPVVCLRKSEVQVICQS